jgi:hypothetical protein
MKSKFLKTAFVICITALSQGAHAESNSGFFLEPGITYEDANHNIDWPGWWISVEHKV